MSLITEFLKFYIKTCFYKNFRGWLIICEALYIEMLIYRYTTFSLSGENFQYQIVKFCLNKTYQYISKLLIRLQFYPLILH